MLVNAQNLLSGNLVPNPSFEEFYSCPPQPCGTGSLTYCKEWFSEYGGGGSSDYFNSIFTSCYNSVQMINIQHPKTGEAFAGICVYLNPLNTNNYREFLEIELKENLKQDKRYCGQYYVSLINPCTYAIENIDMFFSKNANYRNDINLLTLKPQIKNNKGIISDTLNWVKINGSYIASGSEKFITLGNFDSTINTNYINVNYGSALCYYLFDDVSVCECSFDINLGEDTKICEGDNIILTPNLPNATYTWQDSSHIVSYEVKQPGKYWVRAYVAEYDITTTDTITFTAEDETLCNPPLLIPNFITPNGDDNNDFFSIGNSDKYELNLQVFNRWGNLIHQNENYQNDFNCKECADGVFYYLLKSKSKRNEKEKEYKGSMTVFSKQ